MTRGPQKTLDFGDLFESQWEVASASGGRLREDRLGLLQYMFFPDILLFGLQFCKSQLFNFKIQIG